MRRQLRERLEDLERDRHSHATVSAPAGSLVPVWLPSSVRDAVAALRVGYPSQLELLELVEACKKSRNGTGSSTWSGGGLNPAGPVYTFTNTGQP